MIRGFCLALAFLCWAALAQAGEAVVFEAEFEQTRTTPGLERPFESSGTVRWTDEEYLEWQTKEPFEYRYVLTRESMLEELPDGERREIRAEDAPWVLSLNELLMAVVSGDKERMERRFDIEQLGADETDAELELLRLTPRDTALGEQIEVIEVRRADLVPRRIDLHETDGGHTHIRLRPVTGADALKAPEEDAEGDS